MAAKLVLLWLAVMSAGCGVFGSGPSPRLSDAEYIAIARSAPAAEAFYEKYAAADPSVDRSGRLAVDFRAPGARLRLFIENGRVIDAFVECPPGSIRAGDVILAIRACP